MSSTEAFEIDPQAIKELQLLDAAAADVSNEITAKKWLLHAPIFAQRQKTIEKIPGFWATVLDNAAIELEGAITSRDSDIFSHALTKLEVSRPEIPAGAKPTDSGVEKFGEPRSVALTFHFKQNEWFTDSTLSKAFYWRRGKDGSSSLVSDPVKINWKPGKDITNGLTDAAYALWVAQKNGKQLDGVFSGDSHKARDAAAKALPEYKFLAKLLEKEYSEEAEAAGATSFFNFFSYRGRWISAAENVEATNEVRAKRAAALAGQEDDDEDEDDDDEDFEFAEEDVETFAPGHEIALNIAEDIFPDAINYFLADEIEIDSDVDLDSDDEDDDVEMS
ncbi:putative Nap family protein [Seiridium unicorne]|uniref:Nap family protein n=1 Tax=Seiridium unicorne TaxID=138068 RepID=A0ABR2V2H4_9PEZI